MHNHPIRLNSILDNDFYKITMQHGVFQLFPWAKARYKFINRGKHYFPDGFASALKTSIEAMAQVKLTKAEKQFLKETCPYLTPVYLDFLEGFTFNPDEVHIHQNGGDLQVEIEGLWYRTILWEVPIMPLISELFYDLNNYIRWSDIKVQEITRLKIERYKKLSVTVAEFGTRRRHSYMVHDMVMHSLIEHGLGSFIGSSNVHFAMKYKTKPIGTHAHEWFMFHAAKYGYKLANATSLDDWVKVYRGDLGIALSDTYTTKIFLNQFDKMHSKLFDGVRHDSGNPIHFIDQIVNHYEKNGNRSSE